MHLFRPRLLLSRRLFVCSLQLTAISARRGADETMPHWDAQDYAQSWSPEAYYPDGGQLGTGGLYDPPGVGKKHAGGKLAWPAPDHLEPQLQDGNLTNHAVATIERMASGGYGEDVASGKRPFFLAVGFRKHAMLVSIDPRRR